MVQRYNKLDVPNNLAGINPELELRRGPGGKMDVTISYPRDMMKEQLDYSKIDGE